MCDFTLDPRTKLLLLLVVNIAVYSYIPSVILGIYVFIGCMLLLLCKESKIIVLYLALFCIFKYILSFDLVYQLFLLKPIMILGNMFVVFFPLFLYAHYLIITTNVPRFSLALEKLKIPLGIQIALLVMFRFFPTIKVEAKSISNAMKLRGLNFTPVSLLKHPIKTIEYLYVPLVYSLIKTGDELTVASLTRGLGLYKDRTYIGGIGFRFIDMFIIILFIVILTIGFYMKVA